MFNAFLGGQGNGPGGFFHPPGGMGGRHAPARAYDEYFKAYSVAMLPGRERTNLSYGGKIVMPPSALAQLSQLEIESPWLFALKNPSNPAASTHAGVLEFIAEEGVVHLPYWMMKSLRLNEGDPIRVTGTSLPKGKRVKIQPQTVDFLELNDPKAVLEQALRNFSTLTQGDIVEIHHNMITFPILIMEILPEGSAGISIVDTDLEVDFAAPKGYVEPKRPEPAPVPTMASKLKIDLNASTPGSSRPASALGGPAAVAPGGMDWELFKGRGETLAGRRTKGKGISAKAPEAMPEGSRVNRTGNRVIHTDDLEREDTAPAPLSLPFGQLFFGYRYVEYKPPAEEAAAGSSSAGAAVSAGPPIFSGGGATLSGRSAPGASAKGKEKAAAPAAESAPAEKSWGKGMTLSGLDETTASLAPKLRSKAGAASARSKAQEEAEAEAEAAKKVKARSPSIDWDYYDDSMDQDDDDVIDIDSD
ncbi:ubiquitin fusion degradation protein I [Auriculariales sp. MPI-PUGE-AT-0066]|nr:ubiquitin fusion degradation protein I [Auriculariales sp. MPI-PUGE-AT-0066]